MPHATYTHISCASFVLSYLLGSSCYMPTELQLLRACCSAHPAYQTRPETASRLPDGYLPRATWTQQMTKTYGARKKKLDRVNHKCLAEPATFSMRGARETRAGHPLLPPSPLLHCFRSGRARKRGSLCQHSAKTPRLVLLVQQELLVPLVTRTTATPLLLRPALPPYLMPPASYLLPHAS